MIAIVQRVRRAQVRVGGEVVGRVGRGYVVLAGVRRATDAMRHARRMGAGHVSVDADLTGTVLASSVQSTAGPKWSPTPHREREVQR